LPLAGALLLACACGPGADAPPPPPEFSMTRAWSHLTTQVAFGPRMPAHSGHRRQHKWLRDQLSFRADTLIEQKFTAPGEDGKPMQLANFVARFRPELQERVLLVAHLDTRARAEGSPEPLDRRFPTPGANVNASGVAVLMEMAQLLKTQPPRVGVDLLFTDGVGYSRAIDYAGTRHFLRAMPGYRARYAVVLEGVADSDPKLLMDSASVSGAGDATRRMWEVADELGYDTLFVAQAGKARDTQGSVLAAAGIATVVVAESEYGPGNIAWNSTDDYPRLTSEETLRAVGRTLVALVYREQ
ncbi:MAG TPA: M28 family peptidase, partial [Longimicrobium sp.]|nr:M28 family peptidase [Longimicrobium sp.]